MASSKHYYPHFAGLLAEIARHHGADFELLSRGWVKRLHYRGRTAYIWGYHWDLNPAAAQMVCADKFSTHEVLNREGVTHVPHELFMRPVHGETPPPGRAMQRYVADTGFPLVAKPVRGFGGDEVYFLGSQARLAEVVATLFQHHESLALSPYQSAPREIRAITLDGEILLCFAKERPRVTGNGRDPLARLIQAQLPGWDGHYSEDFLDYRHPRGAATVPAAGEPTVVDFRHNLAHGARPWVLESGQRPADLAALVRRTVAALQLRFCSVDCLELESGELRVMEVNAGVIIERFIDLHPEGRLLAWRVYEGAFRALFGC